MSAPPILIVDDEAKLAALLADYLRAAGLPSVVVGNGLDAVAAAREPLDVRRGLCLRMAGGVTVSLPGR
jgi:DNA-binding response OmpR family regulator